MDIDMQTMCIDMLATAGHKGLLATQGTGLLLLGERITHLRPFREGGTGFDSVSELQPVRWPEAFEAGTHNMLGIGAMGAALDFISAEGLEKIAEAERKNIQQLWDGLAEHENITLYGLPPSVAPCAPVISFTVHGWDVEDIGNILQQNHAISVRTGLQCAPLAHKTIGTFPEGTVRISPSYATTEEEINSFLKAIAAVAAVAVPY
jgi:selenocysteine lyase/cysteine desulfurase